MTRIIGLFVLMFVGCATCSPQDVSIGNWLLTSCQLSIKSLEAEHVSDSPYEAMRDGYCTGLVQGIADTSPHVCPGEHVTNGQTIRVVLKYLQDHPEVLNRKSSRLAEEALSKAFPCRR